MSKTAESKSGNKVTACRDHSWSWDQSEAEAPRGVSALARFQWDSGAGQGEKPIRPGASLWTALWGAGEFGKWRPEMAGSSGEHIQLTLLQKPSLRNTPTAHLHSHTRHSTHTSSSSDTRQGWPQRVTDMNALLFHLGWHLWTFYMLAIRAHSFRNYRLSPESLEYMFTSGYKDSNPDIV